MKTVVVSEPLKGIGMDLASELARLGYFVIGWCDNSADAELVKKTISKRFPIAKIEVFVGNLMNFKNIRQTIMNIRLICTQNNTDSIYALICNKHMFSEKYEEQENKIEVQFFENYLANVFLSIGLKDLLFKEKDSRIILPTYEDKDVPKIDEKHLFRDNEYVGAQMFAECKYFNRIFADKWNTLYKDTKALVYIDRIVEEGQYLHEEKPKKGLFKVSVKDKILQGLIAMVNLYDIKNDFAFKYNKAEKMVLSKKQEAFIEYLWELSIDLANLRYFI